MTKAVGDPTRCPQCLKVHGHHPMPEAIVNQCLQCVPKMEGKKLGWACAQYCAHHGIIANGEVVSGWPSPVGSNHNATMTITIPTHLPSSLSQRRGRGAGLQCMPGGRVPA